MKQGQRLTKKKKAEIKEIFLQKLEKSAGVMVHACKALNIDRTTIYQWRKEDEEFNAKIEEVEEICLDMAETALWRNINAGDTPSIIFYLKTKGKKRGYIEKQEIDLSFDKPIDLSSMSAQEIQQLEEIGRKITDEL